MTDELPTSDDAKQEAIRHVHALKGFYIHLLIFCIVITGLAAINILSQSGWWVQWPLLGWGLGIIGHALGVFGPVRLFGASWEERKVRERLNRPRQ